MKIGRRGGPTRSPALQTKVGRARHEACPGLGAVLVVVGVGVIYRMVTGGKTKG